jgi:hypothetical protein
MRSVPCAVAIRFEGFVSSLCFYQDRSISTESSKFSPKWARCRNRMPLRAVDTYSTYDGLFLALLPSVLKALFLLYASIKTGNS